jgi:hypothetical protein
VELKMRACGVGDESFGAKQFAAAQLGDKRRTTRLVQLADAILLRPDASLPRKCGSNALYQGLLGLLGRAEVSHCAVLEPHYHNTYRLMSQRQGQTTLIVGDFTEFDFSSIEALNGQLGPIGNGNTVGFECFNLLAVAGEDGSVIGLVSQTLFRRRRRKLTRTQVRKLPANKRQSGLWALASQRLPPTPTQANWVWVFDREGDTTEALRALSTENRQYVIRSKADRRVLIGHQADAPEGKLHALLRSLPAAGSRQVSVAATSKRAARLANCGVSYAAVELLGSKANGSLEGTPENAWAVRVWELQPLQGEKPLEWLLLSNVAVESLEDACERVDWYERRWVVEEYHKGLKSGVQIEGPQLRSRKRLEPLLGLLSVVAVELLRLRDASRNESLSQRKAVELVDPLLVEVLSAHQQATGSPGPVSPADPSSVRGRNEQVTRAKRAQTKRSDAQSFQTMTVEQFYRQLAKLGGYMGNFRSHPPGWQVLWRGWRELNTMVQGVRAINAAKKCDHL